MKFAIVVLVAVAAFAISQAQVSKSLMDSVRPILLQCAVANNVTQAQLAAIIQNDLSDQSHNIQCASLCFFEALQMMDSAGNLDVVKSIQLFSMGAPEAEVAEVVTICQNAKGADPTDPCETAAAVYACYIEYGLLQPNDQ